MCFVIVLRSRIWLYFINAVIHYSRILIYYTFTLICHQKIIVVLICFFYYERRF